MLHFPYNGNPCLFPPETLSKIFPLPGAIISFEKETLEIDFTTNCVALNQLPICNVTVVPLFGPPHWAASPSPDNSIP